MHKQPNPQKVKAQMFTNMHKAAEFNKEGQKKVHDLITKGLEKLWSVTAIGAMTNATVDAGSDVVAKLKGFQQWAQNRYDDPRAISDPQVLLAYAEVDPEGAQMIAKAATDAAESGRKSGMANSGMAR